MLAMVPRTRVGGAVCADAVVAANKHITAKAAPARLTLDLVIAAAPYRIFLRRET
jgi:hypothetical protein